MPNKNWYEELDGYTNKLSEKEQKEIKKKIQKGEKTFEEMALQYSQDPSAKNAGGSLGFMKRGTLVTEFESVAFNLKPGDVRADLLEEVQKREDLEAPQYRRPSTFIAKPELNEDESNRFGFEYFSKLCLLVILE